MEKTFIRVKGQSKYTSKWNVKVYDESGQNTCKGFPTKREAEDFITELKSKGYKELHSILSWKH